ncbi:MAG: substrate-binding domain-containing protein, partial [Gemmatimonadaceae bacterium]|nr:substrate-binding domain-containing protein [Acetobacteraceae bacterium]
ATGLAEPQRLIVGRDAVAGAAAAVALPGVDAVFAANDAHAIGLLAGLRAAGLARPGPDQAVAVIGLGDLEMGRLIEPRLSTVRVHGAAIGRAAACLLLDHAGPRRIDLGFELVLRESG